MKKLVCIHGHFYQPPRENPWLEEIEREPSAAPHHDWNARIADECYGPNAAARILDGDLRVARLYDNYARMSFNVGPTLLSWMERHAKETLQAIVEADQASVKRLGQGNAIAQVYNHIILPLASERDKRTQVRWGLADFAYRFGRPARGMWLAETAVDAETLDVLADEGMDFTILSPFQARRFAVDGSPWVDCGDGTIPTGRAYRYITSSGKKIALFFYDGSLARGIAFERLLSDASQLTGAVQAAWAGRRALPHEPWLVHTATDGESYGHHFRFGDMALAAAFARWEEDPEIELVNYATFLDRHGTSGDVELHPVSSWSCAHGVGRWERDCGCRMGNEPGNHQRWRQPLRAALDRLRDGLEPFFEQAMAPLADDPWLARDHYVDVLVDRTRRDSFLRRHARQTLSAVEQVRFFQLLEMQRCALLMFTSCGWFFDDIAGPESAILLKYAARALDLAAHAGFDHHSELKQAFLDELANAESHRRRPDGRVVDGRELFATVVETVRVDAERIAIALALRCANNQSMPTHVGTWRVIQHEEHAVDNAAIPCVVGRVGFVDERTGDEHSTAFIVVVFGGLDWRGVLLPASEWSRAQALFPNGPDASTLTHLLDEEIRTGGRGFTLRQAPGDLRDDIAWRALARRLDLTDAVIAELLLSERALLRGVVGLGATLSPSLRALLAHALSRRARDVVHELLQTTTTAAPYLRHLRTLIDDATELGVTLELTAVAKDVEHAVARTLRTLLHQADEEPSPGSDLALGAAVEQVARLVEVLALLAKDRPLASVLPLVARIAARARTDEALQRSTTHLLPALDRACRTSFLRS
jgi:alpha-amylase/alpha-mannosidase (GH57 family)